MFSEEEKRLMERQKIKDSFLNELTILINIHSKENGSDTPDFILAEYLLKCLDAFDTGVKKRKAWYGGKEA